MSVPTRVVFGGLRPLHCHFSYLANKKRLKFQIRKGNYTRENEQMSLVSSSNHQFSGDTLVFRVVRCYLFQMPHQKNNFKTLDTTTMRIAKMNLSK